MIKKILKVVGVIILLIIVLFLLFLGYLWFEDKQRQAEEDKVEMTVRYDLDECPEDFPLFVKILNNSDRTINSVDFDIRITRKGYSKNLAEWGDYGSDKIIEPGSGWESCWKYKLQAEYERYNNPDNLNFTIGYKYIYFQR